MHKDSITITVLPAGATTPTRLERLPNDLAKLRMDGAIGDQLDIGATERDGDSAIQHIDC